MGRKSFASSTQITLSALLESSVLPAKTHITGNFKQFKPATLDPKVDDSTGQIRKPEPRIGIGLLCEVESDGTLVSDYSAQRANPSTLVMVNIALWPKDVRSGDEVGEEIKDMLRDSMTELENSMGRTAKIAVDDMTVVGVTRGKEIVVHMRGEGERMFKVKGRESVKLLKGPVTPAATPGWLGTPASDYATPAEFVNMPTSPVPPAFPAALGLKPLSSHQIPKIDKAAAAPKRPKEDAPSSGQSAPMKRTSSTTSSTVKRPRNEPELVILIADASNGHAMTRTGHSSSSPSKRRRTEERNADQPFPDEGEDHFSSQYSARMNEDPTRLDSTGRDPIREADGPESHVVDLEGNDHSPFPPKQPASPAPQPRAPLSDKSSQENSQLPLGSSSQRLRNGVTPPKAPSSRRPHTVNEKRAAPPTAGSPFNSTSAKPTPLTNAHSERSLQSETSVWSQSDQQQDRMSKKRREAEARARQAAEERQAERKREAQAEEGAMEELLQTFSTDYHTYDTLEALHNGTKANVMGVVVETTQPKETKMDPCMTVVIADPTSHREGRTSEDFAITVFRRSIEDLPRAVSPGTPMLFRGLRISFYNGKLKGQAYSNEINTWAWLSGGRKLRVAKPEEMDPAVNRREEKRLAALYKWWTTVNGPVDDQLGGEIEGGSAAPIPKDGYMLGQVHSELYFDGTFKIMHVVINERGGKKPAFELYVSDGTINPLPTRNFHQVDVGIPSSALFCLAVQDPDEKSDELFQKGNVIKMRNIRAKMYNGGLELAWGNLQTRGTAQQTWSNKKCTLIDKGDHRVQVINTRINQLKRGEIPLQPPRITARPTSDVTALLASPALATHIGTIHTDEIQHPITSLAKIKANTLIPNRFRVQARVKSLRTRELAGNATYLQRHCGHCNRGFVEPYCLSCNDSALLRAEVRYRFIAILEQDDVLLPIVIADEDANEFLPFSPTYAPSVKPADLGKLDAVMKKRSAEVDRILLGPKQDGQWSRPIIDWTLETVEATSGKAGPIIVHRPFGMRSRN